MAENTAPAPEPKAVIGGAQQNTVTVEPIAPPVTGDDVIMVRTTAPGTLGPGGIVPVGTKCKIALSAYSANWMAPLRPQDAEVLEAYLGN